MKKDFFIDAAIIVSALTGILYLMGNIYYRSWFSTMGLDYGLLVQDTYSIIRAGFAPIYVFGFMILCLVVFSLWAFLNPVRYFKMKVVPWIKVNLPETYNFFKRFYVISGDYRGDFKSDHDQYFFMSSIQKNIFIFISCLFFLSVIYLIFGSWMASEKMKDIIGRKEIVYSFDYREISIIGCSSVTMLCGIYIHGSDQIEVIKLQNLGSAKVISKPEGFIGFLTDKYNKTEK